MKKIGAIAVIIVLSAIVFAAGSNGVYFLFGTTMPQLDKLNTRLGNYNYTEISNRLVSYGAGFHGTIKDHLLFGFEWSTMSGKEIKSTDGTIKENLSASEWFIDIGYVIVSVAHFNVYPFLGVGAGTMTLTLSEINNLSFDEILDGPTGITRLSTGGFLLNPSLGMDYSLGNFLIGVRGGYTFDPFVGTWKIEDSKVSNGPETSLIGPYVNIMLGFGN
ncbi:hypothetical protein J7L68_02890 [bacterium]|nr:hypothetical protein [bacterium]